MLREDAHDAAVLRAAHLKLDLTVRGCIQRVIAAHADIIASVKLRPALAHDDRPRRDALSAEDLDAEALRLGVTTVAG